MAGARMALLVMTAGCLLGCAEPRPKPAAKPEHRAVPPPPPSQRDAAPAEPPRSVSTPQPRPAPEPSLPAKEPQAGPAATDGPPSWWIERPLWEGARVTVGASEAAASVLEARLAALQRGELMLHEVLGRSPVEVEVTRAQVVPEGTGYRAYVLVVGE